MEIWHKSLMELDGGKADRVAWADIAKALSIILLVIWTLYGSQIYFNQMLILARMPLFFFVSGLFAHRVITRSDIGTFLREKVGNLLYLYVIWAVFLFLSTELVAHFWWGAELDAPRQLEILWNPVVDMWFLYGLSVAFLLAFLCRNLPIWIVFTALLAAYFVAVATGDWLYLPVFEKIVRLLPYFWLGLVLRPTVWRLVDQHWRLWPLFVAAYFALSFAVFNSPWQTFGPLTFLITVTGIAALLLFSAQLSRFHASWVLGVIGASTLYIYVTYHITIFYMDRLYGLLEWRFEGTTLITGVAVIVLGTMLGRWSRHRGLLDWAFRAPWISPRRGRNAEGQALHVG